MCVCASSRISVDLWSKVFSGEEPTMRMAVCDKRLQKYDSEIRNPNPFQEMDTEFFKPA